MHVYTIHANYTIQFICDTYTIMYTVYNVHECTCVCTYGNLYVQDERRDYNVCVKTSVSDWQCTGM